MNILKVIRMMVNEINKAPQFMGLKNYQTSNKNVTFHFSLLVFTIFREYYFEINNKYDLAAAIGKQEIQGKIK